MLVCSTKAVLSTVIGNSQKVLADPSFVRGCLFSLMGQTKKFNLHSLEVRPV